MTTFVYVLVIFLLLFVMAPILSSRVRRWLRGFFVCQPSATPVSVDDGVMDPDAFHVEFLKRADAFLQMQKKGF